MGIKRKISSGFSNKWHDNCNQPVIYNPVGDKSLMSNIHTTVDALIELINTGDEADRCFASKTLGVFRDKRAIPALIEHLQDEDIDVCIDAAEALGHINDQQAIPALLESLKNDPDGEVKTMVTEALGMFNSREALDALLQVAAGEPEDMIIEEGDDWNDWWDMQLKSVKVLGQRRETRAVPVLKALMEDDDIQDIEPEIYKALAQIGGDGIDVLVEVLKTNNQRSRRRAILALGHSNDPVALRILGHMLKDGDAGVRAATIESLSCTEAANYLGAILVMLKDNDDEVRRVALDAITRLGETQIDDEQIPHITALLTDTNSNVLLNTLNVLNQLTRNEHNNPQAISETDRKNIQANLQHTSFTVQAAACTLLGTLKQRSALDELLTLANNTEQHAMTRREAINAVSAIAIDHAEVVNDELINTFSHWVLDESRPVRQAAISNLLNMDETLHENSELASSPIDIVISAAEGKLKLEPEEKPGLYSSDKPVSIPVTVGQTDVGTQTETPEINSGEINYQPVESELDEQPAQQAAMSTLEALTMDNVEMTLASEQAESTTREQQLSPEEKEEYQEYFDLLETNKKRGEKMKAPIVDNKTDARYLSLQLLGQQACNRTVKVLIDAMDNHDAKIRYEAITSLGKVALNPQPPKDLLNAFGRLITLMHSDIEDNRLACVKTLGDMRHRAAIPEIINHLTDEDYHVRLHSVQALAKLCQLQIDQGNNDPKDQMVINDMDTEDIIAEISKALDDEEPGVQIAVIESLLALCGIREENDELEKIIRIALDDQGTLTRRIAQLLRHNYSESAGAVLIEKMQAAEDSAHRRFIIEMLEELYKPEVLAA